MWFGTRGDTSPAEFYTVGIYLCFATIHCGVPQNAADNVTRAPSCRGAEANPLVMDRPRQKRLPDNTSEDRSISYAKQVLLRLQMRRCRRSGCKIAHMCGWPGPLHHSDLTYNLVLHSSPTLRTSCSNDGYLLCTLHPTYVLL